MNLTVFRVNWSQWNRAMNLFVVARGDRQVDRYLNIAVRRALVFFIHEYRIVSVNKYFSMACAIVRSANICMSPLQHVLHRFFFSRFRIYRVHSNRTWRHTSRDRGWVFRFNSADFQRCRVLYAFNFRYGRLAFVTEREVSNFLDKGKGTFSLRIFFLSASRVRPEKFFDENKSHRINNLNFLKKRITLTRNN